MSALVILAPGFEEIEAITVIDVLRRAEIETVVAGLGPNPIVAARATQHLAEIDLADVPATREFELLVLPGGAEGATKLGASPLVKDWLFRQRERSQWVGAICAGPSALLAHGWLQPAQKIICHPSVQALFPPGQVQTKARVVVDGQLITGLAAGAALEFAYELVLRLRGERCLAQVDAGVWAQYLR